MVIEEYDSCLHLLFVFFLILIAVILLAFFKPISSAAQANTHPPIPIHALSYNAVAKLG